MGYLQKRQPKIVETIRHLYKKYLFDFRDVKNMFISWHDPFKGKISGKWKSPVLRYSLRAEKTVDFCSFSNALIISLVVHTILFWNEASGHFNIFCKNRVKHKWNHFLTVKEWRSKFLSPSRTVSIKIKQNFSVFKIKYFRFNHQQGELVCG